jgi:hypothetical protein
MTKLFTIKIIKLLFAVIALAALPFSASANGFSANADITVSTITFGDSSVDMTILNGSSTGSFTYDGGIFTVTDPETFKVSASDQSVYGIRATLSGNTVACVKNSDPGTSYLIIPNMAGEYTIEPIDTNLSHSLTYNSACGAATCKSGFAVFGTGANAVCVIPSSGGTPIWMLQQQQVVVPVPPTTPVDESIPDTPSTPATPVPDTSAEIPAFDLKAEII